MNKNKPSESHVQDNQNKKTTNNETKTTTFEIEPEISLMLKFLDARMDIYFNYYLFITMNRDENKFFKCFHISYEFENKINMRDNKIYKFNNSIDTYTHKKKYAINGGCVVDYEKKSVDIYIYCTPSKSYDVYNKIRNLKLWHGVDARIEEHDDPNFEYFKQKVFPGEKVARRLYNDLMSNEFEKEGLDIYEESVLYFNIFLGVYELLESFQEELITSGFDIDLSKIDIYNKGILVVKKSMQLTPYDLNEAMDKLLGINKKYDAVFFSYSTEDIFKL